MKQWILRTASLLLLLTRLGAIDSRAQVLTALNMRNQMVRDWERAKAYTLDYLHTMPAGKYDFKPATNPNAAVVLASAPLRGPCFAWAAPLRSVRGSDLA